MMLGNRHQGNDTDTSTNRESLLKHQRSARWRWAFAGAVAGSLVVLFTPGSGVPTAPPGTDKVIHGALFAALATTGVQAGVARRWLTPALAAYAVGSEFVQGALGWLDRSPSAADVAADLAGVAAGVLVTAWAQRRARTRVPGAL